MTGIDREALRKLARSATPDYHDDPHDLGIPTSDAAFIAAANPATVLRLLDALIAAEKRAEWFEERIEEVSDAIAYGGHDGGTNDIRWDRSYVDIDDIRRITNKRMPHPRAIEVAVQRPLAAEKRMYEWEVLVNGKSTGVLDERCSAMGAAPFARNRANLWRARGADVVLRKRVRTVTYGAWEAVE